MERVCRGRSDGVVTLLVSAFLALLVGGASGLAAQEGALEGRVRDDEGSVIRGAVVELLRAEERLRAVETDDLGFFRLSRLMPGPAEVRGQHESRVRGLTLP